jgi:predicted nucleotidyltransferase
MEFLKSIASRLEAAGIRYMVTGSVAATFYAVPRLTRDIDVVIECGPEGASRLYGVFAPDCYVDEDAVREAVSRRGIFNVIHNDWLIKADFIVRRDDAYRDAEFERRRRIDLEGTGVWVVAPEDLILSKLLWARDSDSEMQKQDARAILRSVKDLDRAYLERWAVVLDLAGPLRGLETP